MIYSVRGALKKSVNTRVGACVRDIKQKLSDSDAVITVDTGSCDIRDLKMDIMVPYFFDDSFKDWDYKCGAYDFLSFLKDRGDNASYTSIILMQSITLMLIKIYSDMGIEFNRVDDFFLVAEIFDKKDLTKIYSNQDLFDITISERELTRPRRASITISTNCGSVINKFLDKDTAISYQEIVSS